MSLPTKHVNDWLVKWKVNSAKKLWPKLFVIRMYYLNFMWRPNVTAAIIILHQKSNAPGRLTNRAIKMHVVVSVCNVMLIELQS